MNTDDPIYKVFGPLSQGAPGNDSSTLHALHAVPDRYAVRRVLDLGVGRGRTTLALAHALPDAQVTAVEIHAPFVERMVERAREAGLANRVHAVCGDMETLDVVEGSVDLIWAEGSIYVIGMERALAMWRPWLRPGGCAAFSDFVRWADDPSEEVREFWAIEYPDMTSEAVIRSRAEAAGYRVVGSFRMSKEAHDAYYLPLEARAVELAERVDAGVSKVLDTVRQEIDMVRRFPDEAGYAFFVFQRADGRTRTAQPQVSTATWSSPGSGRAANLPMTVPQPSC